MGNEKMEKTLELIVVIMLGVTAVFTAWASWVSSLHGSNQADNYTLSNILAAEGNSEYNAGVQSLMQDMLLYNEINSMEIDLVFAEEYGDTREQERLEWKLDELMENNISDELYDAYSWARMEADRIGENVSPFEMEGFVDAYFEAANELLAESEDVLAQGQLDNQNSSNFGLATVIYAVVLFLLGIVGTFKGQKNKIAVIGVACVAFLLATIYMLTLPLPTDFSLGSFFAG